MGTGERVSKGTEQNGDKGGPEGTGVCHMHREMKEPYHQSEKGKAYRYIQLTGCMQSAREIDLYFVYPPLAVAS